MAGTGLYWGRGEDGLRALAEAAGIPVFLNGLGRGCLPADHDLAFSRARGAALKGADLALVIGVPMDFRLGFGASFGDETEIVVVDVAEPARAHPRPVAAELYGTLPDDARRAAVGRRRRGHRAPGSPSCAPTEDEKLAGRAPTSSPTPAPRCIPCACSPSSPR